MVLLKTILCDCQSKKRPQNRAYSLQVERTEAEVKVVCLDCKTAWQEAEFINQYRTWQDRVSSNRLKDNLLMKAAEYEALLARQAQV